MKAKERKERISMNIHVKSVENRENRIDNLERRTERKEEEGEKKKE